mmetsp:Transcript_1385/g.6165  ORF Transcript_1385/g.6165 Transcript_1385/m.6165 type:complete len:129 (-) Transcript_1385:118-504(-)
MITPELFVNLAKGMFGGYSAMMLLMPKKMVTDHFKAECDPMTEFWIRGSSVGFFGLIYAIHKLPLEDAVDISLATTVATALLYPYNAKFGILSKGLPLKYDGFPNHYVPEVMMGALAVAGCIAKFVKK